MNRTPTLLITSHSARWACALARTKYIASVNAGQTVPNWSRKVASASTHR